MLRTIQLAARLFWREWRAGEWLIIMSALITTVAALTALDFYSDRLNRALQAQSAILLGGDLVVSSPSPIPDKWKSEAEKLELRTAEIWTYPSVVSANNQLQLVSINAVSKTYPLMEHSQLRPERGNIWVEERLLPLLSLQQSSTIKIGSASFQIARNLPANTEALNTGWLIAPRVLMLIDDVPSTKTVIRGSRVDYRFLLTGSPSSLNSFRQWVTPQLSAGQRLIDVYNQRSPMRSTLEQVTNYLHLLILASMLMSGVAIALSVRQYLQRHYAHAALWRVLGMKKNEIQQIVVTQLFIAAFVSGILGSITGYILQLGIESFFQTDIMLSLPAASAMPFITGISISILLLFGFAYPVINELPRTPPLMLWRSELSVKPVRDYFYLFISILAILAFIAIFIGFSTTMLFYTAAMLFSVVTLYFLSHAILALLRNIAIHCDGAIRHGINQMIRHPGTVSTQITGFTLILSSLLTLGLIRGHLLDQWQTSVPARAPNYFAMNIAPDDVNKVRTFFNDKQIEIEKIDPIVRGRLTRLNNIPILSAVPPEARSNNALHRELNLSWMRDFPSDNKIVLGKKWEAKNDNQALVSVEKNVADELGLKLGDILQFQIGDQSISAAIYSVRTLNWSSFHPNFYMIFPPGILDQYPATYITSFHLKPNQTIILNQLVSQFPNITIIDLASILTQVKQIVNKAALSIQYIFIFLTIIAGLIFIVSLQATLDERRQTYRIMYILGASKKYIYQLIIIEFSLLLIVIMSSASLISFIVTLYINHLIYNL